MAALRNWWLPVLMGVGQLLAWPIGPRLVGQPPSALDAAVAVVVTVVVAVALGWRRRAPEVALAVIVPTLVAGTVALPTDALSVIAVADLVTLFSLAVLRPARVVGLAVALLVAGWVRGARRRRDARACRSSRRSWQSSTCSSPRWAVAAGAGGGPARRPAARLVAAELEEQRAAEVERDRLARELHDVTAHHLTAVVVHAGAARRLGADRPELVAKTLTFAADTGRRTLTALDRLVTVIEPAVEPLASRLARVAAVAVEVSVEVTGPVDELPAAGRRRGPGRGAGGRHQRDAVRGRGAGGGVGECVRGRGAGDGDQRGRAWIGSTVRRAVRRSARAGGLPGSRRGRGSSPGPSRPARAPPVAGRCWRPFRVRRRRPFRSNSRWSPASGSSTARSPRSRCCRPCSCS
jgi:signal transduction histidine kinase